MRPLNVPKCEIFDRSDFHDFFTIKPFSFWVGDFGLKYKLVTLIFEGARHQFLTHTLSACISSWRTRSVQAPVPKAVPYAHDQHVLKGPFQIWNFYAYDEHTRKKLILMLRVRISSCAGIFRQPMRARNRVGIRLSFRPARLHRLAESIPWNRLLGSIKV
jgi:hypothetical protein